MKQTKAKILRDGVVIDGARFAEELDEEEKRKMTIHFEEVHGSDIEVEYVDEEQRCPDTEDMFGEG